LDNTTTCLVGKNEAGKTALLEAIYRLNPIIETDGNFDVTDDFPRSTVEDYSQTRSAMDIYGIVHHGLQQFNGALNAQR
jgi:ABC-type cobalamin/Fe3+-siderophores transport system ATPase subunit